MMFTEEYEDYIKQKYTNLAKENKQLQDAYMKLTLEHMELRSELTQLKNQYIQASNKIKRQQEQLRKLNGHEVRN